MNINKYNKKDKNKDQKDQENYKNNLKKFIKNKIEEDKNFKNYQKSAEQKENNKKILPISNPYLSSYIDRKQYPRRIRTPSLIIKTSRRKIT